jgi:hypothetical protein
MKMRLLLTLAGLAIGFAVPAFAQDKDTVDPQVRQQIEAVLKKHEEAYNKYDAGAFAAGLTQYAVELGAGGLARVGKKSKKGMQPNSHRTPQSSHSRLSRCAPSATPYARSRNFLITIHKRRVTMPRSMFVRVIPGRSAWPTSIDVVASRCFSLTPNRSSRPLALSPQQLLAKGVDPSALPATRLLPATQEIPQRVVRRQTILKTREEKMKMRLEAV